ncbi:MAG: hypothetical protein RLZZ480_887 [Candidatus Parcubacteria bacterium]|jgi:hypothetical protein
MLKFALDLVNFIFSLFFGAVALAAGLLTVYSGFDLLYYGYLSPLLNGTEEILSFVGCVVATLVSYSITAALREWPNPLGKYQPWSREWNSH